MPDGKIFISYRRGADSNAAGRLYGRLERTFGRARLFFDVDSIPPGIDFVDHLNDQVGQCQAFLAVVGTGWLAEIERLNDPNDFVRIEIEAALARPYIPIIPVLIDGVPMAAAQDLPESLAALVRRSGVPLRHESFAAVVDGRLTRALRRALGELDAGEEPDDEVDEPDEISPPELQEPEEADRTAPPNDAGDGTSSEEITPVPPPQRRGILFYGAIGLLLLLVGFAAWKLPEMTDGSNGPDMRRIDPTFKKTVGQLSADDQNVRREARSVLTRQGPDLIQPTMRVLANKDLEYRTRLGLVVALTEMMRENKVERTRIIKMLSVQDLELLILGATSKDDTLRKYASEFLYDLGDPRSFELALRYWKKVPRDDARFFLALIMKGAAPHLNSAKRAEAKRTLSSLKGVVGPKTDKLLDEAIRALRG